MPNKAPHPTACFAGCGWAWSLCGNVSLMIKRAVIFSFIHVTVLLLCMYVFLLLATDRARTENAVQSRAESTFELVVKVLSTPGRLIKSVWPGKLASGFVEWVLFIANSLIWGGVLAVAYTKVRNAT